MSEFMAALVPWLAGLSLGYTLGMIRTERKMLVMLNQILDEVLRHGNPAIDAARGEG